MAARPEGLKARRVTTANYATSNGQIVQLPNRNLHHPTANPK